MAIQTFEEFAGGGEVQSLSFDDFSGGKAVSSVRPETEKERLSFTQRFNEDLEKRRNIANEISDAVTSGEQTFAEGVLQTAGKVGVGGTFDLIIEGVVSAFRALPDFIEKPIRTATSSFLETDIAQRGLKELEKGAEFYNKWKQTNPRAARNLEAIVNIGALIAPVKPRVKAPVTKVGRAGEIIETKAVAQVAEKRGSFIEDLVRPEQTKAVREAQVGRTTERGLLREKVIAPSVAEKAIASEVSKIKGVSRKNTLQKNFSAINTENRILAKSLVSDITKNDFFYPKRELISELNTTKARIAENPLIVGDAEKVAEKLITKFNQFVQEQTGKGSGLLVARKKFDKWVESQKGTNVFDPKNENALTISLREIRQTANNFLDTHAKNVAVKDSLKKQSTLFRALDNIKPKAASEGANVVVRAWQNVLRILPLRGEFNQVLAVAFGLGGLGASAVFAPFFTKLVLGSLFAVGAGKIIMGAGMKKALSKLLSGIDDAIRKTKDVNLIKELRADRAIILDMLRLAEEGETEESQTNESDEATETESSE